MHSDIQEKKMSCNKNTGFLHKILTVLSVTTDVIKQYPFCLCPQIITETCNMCN